MDCQMILNTVVAALLVAVIVGVFTMRESIVRLEAEFRAFRHEVLRFMDAREGD
jgi:uncharacterized protein YneF (UPF0154 family)